MSAGALAPHRELGLTDAEYEGIRDRLGRDPNALELAVFSLMWSEHCAYKHSKKLLRELPTEGPHLLMGPGENAGVVDVGDGLAVAFKVESHNHPSAVEPFQGAATGVGGILRDIFAVGARPIAVLDSLRFGELESARSRYLFDWAVKGIGHYGNSIGVPTVGGEVYFEPAYEQNCLVNAMCVGLARHERLIRSAAAGVGNPIVLLGARTGRDGIGGASVLASAELSEADASKRPSVQIGDPFEESKLVECCLDLLDRELLASLQDLGAAGLSSSSSEMASKGEVGIDIDVARVPLREADMEPFEIMISESQERMLCVVEPALLDDVLSVCERWDVRATPIGTVTDSRRLRVFDRDVLVGDMPVEALVDDCPLYDLSPLEPDARIYPAPPARLAPGASPDEALLALLASPNVASKRFVFEQYDPIVGSRTVRRPQAADAAVLKLENDGGSGAIAVAIDGNGRRVACDPYVGAAEAVLECARNLACVGAEPLGLTNCLNFGNPEKPHIAWQLTRAVEGLRDACLALGVPVVGGNVSLYNEGGGGPIYPTPIVGMVGKLPDPGAAPRTGFASPGHAVALVGPFRPALEGSELEKLRGRLADGLPPADLAEQAAALEELRAAARSGALATVHDVADGGLAVALAECCIEGDVGARIDLGSLASGEAPPGAAAADAPLFGEGPGGAVIAGPPEAVAAVRGARVIGEVGGDSLDIAGALRLPVADLRDAYEGAIPAAFAPG
ncbi:MAG TPA: phosphoribosylformylglycinamidine synthase subunit PurL [Thermoleophilaceae bacterium]|nr:phosphoribosylformylglycinamidine synthase subunit PurL [Thermoleophilaceae bacterium]